MTGNDGTKLEELAIEGPVAEIIRCDGIEHLYPPQVAALRPVIEGKSVVLACPTASGKSLVAYVAVVNAARKGHRGLYIVPLRALASEKYAELKAFEKLGIRIGLTMGEWDISPKELDHIDILVATSEKTDSLLRHKSKWMEGVAVVVADEVHLMREPTRGPTLEVTLTRLKRLNPSVQIVALSATVANSLSIASWIGAEHVRSDFRPVPLKYGVYHEGVITFLDNSERQVEPPGEPVERLVRSIVKEGGQALIFVSTRKASETMAERMGALLASDLSDTEKREMRDLSQRLLGTGEETTASARQLSTLVLQGTAYHNASLTNGERILVEKAFRKGLLKCLSATPTLAAGVNLPARRVIVKDLSRYEATVGLNAPLPVFEVHQMCGRAGRPRYDTYGEAILIARNEDDCSDLMERYLRAPPEEVDSKLASENVLRTHLLALVASDDVRDEKDLEDFIRGTFYGHEYAFGDIKTHLYLAKEFLVRHGFLVRGELKATPFGKLASDLYLDPVTAIIMRQALRRSGSKTKSFSYLAAMAATPDVAPLYMRRDDYPEVQAKWHEEVPGMLVTGDEELLAMEEETFLSTIKTAMVVEEWIDDRKRIADITEHYGLGAGDLHGRVERMSWLLSSMAQLARWERRSLANSLDELAFRVSYGIRPELMDLVSLRGIGRVRGRLLYQNGIRTRDELSRASPGDVARYLGSPVIAREVLQQLKVFQGKGGTEPEAEEDLGVQRDLFHQY